MSGPASHILIIPPASVAGRLIPEALKMYMEAMFPGFLFTLDTISTLPGEYFGLVVTPMSDTKYRAPDDDECVEIVAALRGYGDGKKTLN